MYGLETGQNGKRNSIVVEDLTVEASWGVVAYVEVEGCIAGEGAWEEVVQVR
jgi:hypothetical protein